MEDLDQICSSIQDYNVLSVNEKSEQNTQNVKNEQNQSKQMKDNKKKDKQQKQQMKQENIKDIQKEKQNKMKKERSKPIDQMKELNFAPIGSAGSQISIWHRPTNVHINLLKSELEVTLIVSLQGEREHISEVKHACASNDIQWFNIPLEGANETLLSSKDVQSMVQTRLQELKNILLTQKHKALLHCAAGIHRTGTITYSLLRIFGNEPEQAMQILQQLREITSQQVGIHRIDIAEKYFVQPITVKKIKNEEIVESEQKNDE